MVPMGRGAMAMPNPDLPVVSWVQALKLAQPPHLWGPLYFAPLDT